MLNPESNNFVVEFGRDFYSDVLMEKYNKFLYTKNYPIKNIEDHIHESIQGLTIPGLATQALEVNGIKNFNSPTETNPTTSNFVVQKNQPLIEMFETNRLNLTCKNTIINWMYFYEFLRIYSLRGDKDLRLSEFTISVLVRDASNIPMLYFDFRNCFSASLPTLDFAQNSAFNETKTIDVGFWFNEMDVRFVVPEFKIDGNVG